MKAPAGPHSDSSQESARLRRSTLVGVLVVIGVGAILYIWSGISSRRLFAEASTALDQGKINTAEALISKYLRARPESGEAAYLSARLRFARNQHQEVLQLLAKARDKGYPELPLERLLGLVYAQTGNPREAEPRLLASWESDNRPDAQVADALLTIYFQAYRFGPAFRIAEEWQRRSPEELRALLWKAEIRTWDDSSAEAQIGEFDAVLARDPNQHQSRLNRAGALFRIGRLEESKRDYALYIKAKPDDPEGYLGAAKTAEGLDDEDAALALYESALKLDPKNVVGLKSKAAILIRRKDYQGALPLLDLAIQGAPDDPEPHYRKSQALERLGKSSEAKGEFAIREKLRQEQEEYERLRKGMVRNPNDTKLMTSAAAWLLMHRHEKEGITWAEKALSADPKSVATIKLLADYYAKKGDTGRSNFYKLMLPPGS